MKTPDVIKKGLERCKDDRCICDECEFSDGNVKKWRSLMGDALAYIKQLENHISLNTMRDAIYEDAVKHGLWDDVEDYMPADCMSAFCEVLANAIISSLSVAGKLGIDIDAAVRRKMERNKR